MVNSQLYKAAFLTLVVMFGVLTTLWLWLRFTGQVGEDVTHWFGVSYGLVALVGGIFGLFAARSWGFFKSMIGRAIIFLSFGLLLAEFGQLVYTYLFVIEGIEVPYPSIADIGFFGAIPMYIIGAIYLMLGLGSVTILKKNPLKLVVGIAIPLVVLGVSYAIFLRSYDPTDLDWLTIFLDFGYPLGQAVYVSLALVTLLSVGALLGGKLRLPVFMLLLAFLLQYTAEFNFLSQNIAGTWVNGGYGDFLYLTAYFTMGVSILALNRGLSKTFVNTKPAAKGVV